MLQKSVNIDEYLIIKGAYYDHYVVDNRYTRDFDFKREYKVIKVKALRVIESCFFGEKQRKEREVEIVSNISIKEGAGWQYLTKPRLGKALKFINQELIGKKVKPLINKTTSKEYLPYDIFEPLRTYKG